MAFVLLWWCATVIYMSQKPKTQNKTDLYTIFLILLAKLNLILWHQFDMKLCSVSSLKSTLVMPCWLTWLLLRSDISVCSLSAGGKKVEWAWKLDISISLYCLKLCVFIIQRKGGLRALVRDSWYLMDGAACWVACTGMVTVRDKCTHVLTVSTCMSWEGLHCAVTGFVSGCT